jgi:hypothetical protein
VPGDSLHCRRELFHIQSRIVQTHQYTAELGSQSPEHTAFKFPYCCRSYSLEATQRNYELVACLKATAFGEAEIEEKI